MIGDTITIECQAQPGARLWIESHHNLSAIFNIDVISAQRHAILNREALAAMMDFLAAPDRVGDLSLPDAFLPGGDSMILARHDGQYMVGIKIAARNPVSIMISAVDAARIVGFLGAELRRVYGTP